MKRAQLDGAGQTGRAEGAGAADRGWPALKERVRRLERIANGVEG
jgi:hypothetical protein